MTDINELDALVLSVAEEARSLGIPVSRRIKKVVLNTRAKSRLGSCRREKKPLQEEFFVIELSRRLGEAEVFKIKEVIAHELLHTCPGCMNHGKKWKLYAQMMNETFGYEITRTYTDEKMGISPLPSAEQYRYTVVCKGCGAVIRRKRRCPLVNHPELYRCGKCGGMMKLCEKSTTSCR